MTVCLQQIAFTQTHAQKPSQEKALADTILFDINQAVYSTVGSTNYIEIPVMIKSTNTAITSFDFWFQFNLNKLTFSSSAAIDPGLDQFTAYSSSNLYLSNLSSGLSLSYVVPVDVPLLSLKFILANACTEITAQDFYDLNALIDSDVSVPFFQQNNPPIEVLSASPFCSNNDIVFTYPTTATYNGSSIAAYAWNFGNGNVGNSATDSSQFAQGPHTVNLTLTTLNGCSYSVASDISVLEVPQAAFSAVYNAGPSEQVFTNESSISTGTITQYAWDFGDASPIVNVENPTHAYPNAGSYNVTLTVTASNGCSNVYDSIVSSIGGTFDLDFSSMTLSPNPSASNCQIVSDKYFSGTMIIENMNGAIILEKKIQGTQFNVDLATYANGTYVVKLANNAGKKIFKVIKL